MRASNSDWSRVKTTETAFNIIEFLQENDGADLITLTSELDLVKSTIHRHIGTLQDRGYVIQDDGEYHVGLKFANLGGHARRRKEEYELARDKVQEMADETEERVQFMIEEQGAAAYVHIEHGKNAVKTDPGPGRRTPIHAAASGKAILAYMPDERVEQILARQGLAKLTENTITDRDELDEQLQAIRQRGIAYNDEEAIDGLFAIGVPVNRPNDRPIGALSISGPVPRMKGKAEEELREKLLGTANELELNISYS
jgi:DNA-binding IclR family transcriptional regulator